MTTGAQSSPGEPLVRGVSDTALWVACFRAWETERQDALFCDPYAQRLAGERGFQIASKLTGGSKNQWAWAARTRLFDELLLDEIQAGAKLVVNLAAGLDARPYRMALPPSLCWVEVDLPEIIAYKQAVLDREQPRCGLERISLNLADVQARRGLFADLDRAGQRIVVLAEGLLIYFTDEEAASLAADLAAGEHFQSWIIDLASPGQLRLMQRTMGVQLSQAGATFRFGPREGAHFFSRYGWAPQRVEGLLKTAAARGRLPAELHSFLPEPEGLPGNYPWSGVCALTKMRSHAEGHPKDA